MSEVGVDREQVALNLLDAYFYQIFMIGFFHADPHPGNIFVRPVPPGFMSWDGAGRSAHGRARSIRGDYVASARTVTRIRRQGPRAQAAPVCPFESALATSPVGHGWCSV